jgi:hypothetical protein
VARPASAGDNSSFILTILLGRLRKSESKISVENAPETTPTKSGVERKSTPSSVRDFSFRFDSLGSCLSQVA